MRMKLAASGNRETVSRVVLAVLCASVSLGCRANIPEKVTADGLLSVKKGMSFNELEKLIGPPLCYEEWAGHERCFSDPTAVPLKLQQANLTLSYTYPSEFTPFFEPDIYVSMTKGHVRSVYIKYQDFGICCMEGLPTSPFYWVGSRELLKQLIGK